MLHRHMDSKLPSGLVLALVTIIRRCCWATGWQSHEKGQHSHNVLAKMVQLKHIDRTFGNRQSCPSRLGPLT